MMDEGKVAPGPGKPDRGFGLVGNLESNARAAGTLYKLTAGYFFIPCLIFIFGFLRLPVALPVAALLMAAIFYDFRFESRRRAPAAAGRSDGRTIALIVLLAFLWTGLFGIGFVGPQTGDQVKNHMIFRDLVLLDWPVIFNDLPREMKFLSYPLGYYLVPALVGKLGTWSTASFVFYLWAGMGVGLLWTWFRVFFGRFVWFAIIVFIFWGGLDVIGMLVRGQGMPQAGTHLEWWAGWTFLQYSSAGTVMSWSTQHSAAQWLLPSMLLYRIIGLKTARGTALAVSIASFWSHLSLLGAAVFIPLILKDRKTFMQALKDPSLLAVPFLLTVFLFYASKTLGAVGGGFIWELWDMKVFLPRLILFCFLEFVVVSLLIYSQSPFESKQESLLFKSSVILLALTPLVHIGWSNDISMRVSAIPLYVLFVFFCVMFARAWRSRNRGVIALSFAYLTFASFSSANEMYRQLESMWPQSFFMAPVSDANWERGVSRARSNCFITEIPRDFSLRAGDEVGLLHRSKRMVISEAFISGYFQNVCGPAGWVIKNRASPESRLRARFYRNGEALVGEFHIRFMRTPDQIDSISGLFPGQYTGSQGSLFYRVFLKSSD